MSLESSIQQDAIEPLVLDGWDLNLKFASNKSIDLEAYENFIQAAITADSLFLPSSVILGDIVLPIVFHLVVDDINLVRPSAEIEDIQFNANEVLKDINNSFSGSGISFCLLQDDLSARTPLAIPGINYIDASTLSSSVECVGRITNYDYKKFGVAITPNFKNNNNTSCLGGIPMQEIINTYGYDPKKVINIFLINSFAPNINAITMSSNPYIFDSDKDSGFNIVMPFYALGNPFKSDAETGYGYRYYSNPEFKINSKLSQAISISNTTPNYYSSSYNKSFILAKSLGHLLGLASTNNFLNNYLSLREENPYFNSSCNTNCVYTRFKGKDYCGDCVSDTDPTQIYNPLDLTNVPEGIGVSCFNSVTAESNIMNNFIPSSEAFTKQFSPLQIKRMRANIGMLYFEESEEGVVSGISAGVLHTLTTSPYINNNHIILENVCEEETSNVAPRNFSVITNASKNNLEEYSSNVSSIKNITNEFI